MVGKMDFFLAWIVNQTYQIEQEIGEARRAARRSRARHGGRCA